MATKTKTDGNPMRNIHVAKVTLNIGAGKDENVLKKGITLLQKITPLKPVKTMTKKRIPGWSLRPGLEIGTKVTVRKNADVLLKRLLVAKENTLASSNFDERGNFAFGIPEYIEIEGLDYDPELKIMGLEAAVTLERPGYRIKRRKVRPARVGKSHQITKEEAVAFIRAAFGVEVQP
ncbi:50S ribosomal protein L5 [Candidatus Woesearchaeota archaeon]|nr:50S ribosomal protein L5 [Candidatus Woesearchaeota archaeon]